jgi:hypothetical protein
MTTASIGAVRLWSGEQVGNHIVKAAALVCKFVNSIWRNSDQPRPLRGRMAFAIDGNYMVGSSVIALLAFSGPPAISGLVVAIVIDAIKRRTFRSRPHVAQECREIIAPLIVHGDPPSAVQRIYREPIVETSHFGGCPRTILRAVALAVAVVALCGHCGDAATAASRVAAAQIPTGNRCQVSAVAAAREHPGSVFASSCPIQYGQVPKCHPDWIDLAVHRSGLRGHVVKCSRISRAVSFAPHLQPHGISTPRGRPPACFLGVISRRGRIA